MAKSRFQTRVIAGKYKGKSIALPSLETTRSSKGILKESFFNTIQNDIIDAYFVEVFAGSGSVGIEALSRGAAFSIFMEQDKDAFNVLNKNLKTLDISNAMTLKGDSFSNIYEAINYLKRIKQPAYIYIDPPFSIREGHEDIYDKMIAMIEKFPEELIELITIEHMTGLELPDQIGKFSKTKYKKFGKSSLTYYQ
jgi:16S rRNA (guanine(966)-N(2))-methyltransferase RsmD